MDCVDAPFRVSAPRLNVCTPLLKSINAMPVAIPRASRPNLKHGSRPFCDLSYLAMPLSDLPLRKSRLSRVMTTRYFCRVQRSFRQVVSKLLHQGEVLDVHRLKLFPHRVPVARVGRRCRSSTAARTSERTLSLQAYLPCISTLHIHPARHHPTQPSPNPLRPTQANPTPATPPRPTSQVSLLTR